jgi:hypothetical protein
MRRYVLLCHHLLSQSVVGVLGHEFTARVLREEHQRICRLLEPHCSRNMRAQSTRALYRLDSVRYNRLYMYRCIGSQCRASDLEANNEHDLVLPKRINMRKRNAVYSMEFAEKRRGV